MSANNYCVELAIFTKGGTIDYLVLPPVNDGWVKMDNTVNPVILTELHFETVDGQWHAACGSNSCFYCSGVSKGNLALLQNSSMIEYEYMGQMYYIYSEFKSDPSFKWEVFWLDDCRMLTVGKGDSCEICYKNKYVDDLHFSLLKDSSKWIIVVKGKNEIFLNRQSVNEAIFNKGDVLYLFGLQIIMGAGFIQIGSGTLPFEIRTGSIKSENYLLLQGKKLLAEPETNFRATVFNRLPRAKNHLNPNDIIIEAPPISINSDNIPLMLRMGGSMVMSGAAALSGHYLMLLSSVLFPVLTQKYSDREKKEYEKKRVEKYTAYLRDKEIEINEEINREQNYLQGSYPEFSVVLNYALRSQKQLWERRPVDKDFLVLRLGAGEIPMLAKIDYPHRQFNLEEDALEIKMYTVAEKERLLEKVPILFDLVKYKVLGISGQNKDIIDYSRIILQRLALLHSYDEVRFVFIGKESELKELEFIKYLPHVWDDNQNIRLIATNMDEALLLSSYLKENVENDLSGKEDLNKLLNNRSYYVVFAFDKRLYESFEVLKEIAKSGKNVGVSIVALFNDLPKECSAQISLGKHGSGQVKYLVEPERPDEGFTVDLYNKDLFSRSVKALENTKLKIRREDVVLPKSLSFLEMYGVGKVEYLDTPRRWRENNASFSLGVPIGIASDGTAFVLDLHQRKHGPHGIVAGMTGSGKSEWLITYILSLAVNYPPDEVSFVLIDYKGGGLASAFDDPSRGVYLPHLLGTITNLDGSTIQRSLLSIQSELLRRQRILRETQPLTDAGNVDIYVYQKLFREGVVKEPLPHLFIICDEFAELKQQQPDFMEQLISAARIGRSLGVHLILATQKPAGVVNDQIRSNARFRVCLKVQEKADSMDMLERPEAAELKNTGRFYLQVGYNDQFLLGQSAWSGEAYVPSDSLRETVDNSIRFIDNVGQSIAELRPEQDLGSSQGSQLFATVDYLTRVAKQTGIERKHLWLPELPILIEAREMNIIDEKSIKGIEVKYGLVDDPEYLNQFEASYDFVSSHNLMILGSQGSGKSTLLQTIIRSLVNNYDPSLVQFYCLDFSSRMLKVFQGLPHCGSVLCEEEEASFKEFFSVIQTSIKDRKKLFSSLNLGEYEAVNKAHPIPLIIVIIDNVSGMNATKEGERLFYELPNIVREASSYGIKFVITERYLNAIPSRLRHEFDDVIALQLKDKYEYSEALNCKVPFVPLGVPGRGVITHEGRSVVFQAAMFSASVDEVERVSELKEEIEALKIKYAGFQTARALSVFDPNADYSSFLKQFLPHRIPLGYSLGNKKAVALPLAQFNTLNIYFGNVQGVEPIVSNLINYCISDDAEVYLVRRSKGSRLSKDTSALNGIALEQINIFDSSETEISLLWQSLSSVVSARNEFCKAFYETEGLDSAEKSAQKKCYNALSADYNPVFLIIEDSAEFCLNADFLSKMVFFNILENAGSIDVHAICCYYPDDYQGMEGNYLYRGVNSKDPCLLLGGRYNRQKMCEFPENEELAPERQFNLGLMSYRESFYPIIVPCGVVEYEPEDEDERNIFE